METVVALCNLALMRIGHNRPLSSLEDTGPEALACSLLFDQVRDVVLEARAWPFATRRVPLALLADAERTDWAFVYMVPTGCLTARLLVEPGVRTPHDAGERIPFEVEAGDSEGDSVLLTDLEDAELLYTFRHTHVPAWSAHFKDALAWLLASELALGIRKDAALASAMLQKYERALSAAGAHAAQQHQPDRAARVPASIRARRGGA